MTDALFLQPAVWPFFAGSKWSNFGEILANFAQKIGYFHHNNIPDNVVQANLEPRKV